MGLIVEQKGGMGGQGFRSPSNKIIFIFFEGKAIPCAASDIKILSSGSVTVQMENAILSQDAS